MGAGITIKPRASRVTYDDSVTEVAEPLGEGQVYNVQDCAEALDARLDAVEGDNALTLAGVVLDQTPSGISAYMSDGINFITLVAGATYANCVYQATGFRFTINAATDVANHGDKGTVSVLFDGVDTGDAFDLETAFVELERNAAQSYPPQSSVGGTVRITSVEKFGNTGLFQIWKGYVDIANFLPYGLNAGEHTIQLVHHLTAGDQSSAVSRFVIDSSVTAPSVVGVPTIAENTLSSAKYISGVRKYSTGDTFDIGAVLAGAFDNLYILSPLRISGVAITAYDTAWNSAFVTGPSAPPAVGDGFTYAETGKAIAVASTLDEDAVVQVVGTDPWASGAIVNSAAENRMVNTYGNVSTAVLEDFVDENYRLSHFNTQGDNTSGIDDFVMVPGAITGVWDSTIALADGEALQFDEGMIYPSQNFSVGYLPTNVVNYSAFAADQHYVRAIYENLVSHFAGTLLLAGWALADFDTTGSPKAKVEIKLPGATGWLDLGKPYNAGTFTGIDGDGCRTLESGSQFSWTSGGFSTFSSGYMYIVRITLLDPTIASLTRIYEMGW